MIKYVLYSLHFIASAIAAISVWQMSKRCKVSITLHDSPFILMCTVLLLVAAALSVEYSIVYLYIGIFVGLLSWVSNSIRVENEPEVPVFNKIIAFIVNVGCYPQVLLITIFYLYLYKMGKVKDADMFKP
jgi:hypothetical protein